MSFSSFAGEPRPSAGIDVSSVEHISFNQIASKHATLKKCVDACVRPDRIAAVGLKFDPVLYTLNRS
jgi:hypothetical protein